MKRIRWVNFYFRRCPGGSAQTVHIIPKGDLRMHGFTAACWCRPDRYLEGRARIYAHHAADGRELVEQGVH